MLRFNTLKIYILAGEAKPGGNIGAMLSPYLFSTNMSDFCKKFNEQSKDYLSGVWLPVTLYCDVLEKVYTFNIKYASVTMFLITFFLTEKKISILFLYDLVYYYTLFYKLSYYNSSLVVFSILKSFKRKNSIINISESILLKINNYLCIKKKH